MSQEHAGEGIVLERFSRYNADLVLSWRNAPDVRANFLNNAKITRDAHLAFVDNMANRGDRHYYIVHVNGRPEAVLNVNLDGTEGQWGCYIGEQDTPRPGLFPLLIAISGTLAFRRLGCTSLSSEVVTGNHPPLKVNSFLGITQSGTRRENRPEGGEIEVLLHRVELFEWPVIREQIDKLMTRAYQDILSRFERDPSACIR